MSVVDDRDEVTAPCGFSGKLVDHVKLSDNYSAHFMEPAKKIRCEVIIRVRRRRRVHDLRDGGAADELHGAEHGVAGRAGQHRGDCAAPDVGAELAEHMQRLDFLSGQSTGASNSRMP